ncbi:MAG: ribonuclease HI [Oscillospiraceae bacterium]|nr:ribonuclease HI [Oscillospiraceae bacterium]
MKTSVETGGKPFKFVELYTDGACSGNPGPGGWCAILRYNGFEKILSGGETETTNNRMELLAVIYGLEALKEPCRVRICSDSQYVINALSEGWIEGWRRRGWRRKDGELKNPELWQRLWEALQRHEPTYVWIRGHEDDETNNRCDAIAVSERERMG